MCLGPNKIIQELDEGSAVVKWSKRVHLPVEMPSLKRYGVGCVLKRANPISMFFLEGRIHENLCMERGSERQSEDAMFRMSCVRTSGSNENRPQPTPMRKYGSSRLGEQIRSSVYLLGVRS